MQTFQVYKNLASLNELSVAHAQAAFLDCCGSAEWAGRMSAARPFPMIEDLFSSAEQIWHSLTTADHLEAFAAHPNIGSSKPAANQNKQAADWSTDEQAGMGLAKEDTKTALAEANRLYHEKFGFIFIVCATGKAAEEMLAICRARFGNSVQTELHIAADEQLKITELRLSKLLER